MWLNYTVYAKELNSQREKMRSIQSQLLSGKLSTGNGDTDASLKRDIERYMTVFDRYYDKAVVVNGGASMDYHGDPFKTVFYDNIGTAYNGIHAIKEFGDTILKRFKRY